MIDKLTSARWSALVLSLVAASCATVSPPLEQMSSPPSDAVEWTNSTDADAGTILVARDAGFAGAGLYVYFSIDGHPAARLDRGERVSLRVSPGRHTVTWFGRGALNQDGTRPASMEVTVEARQRLLLRCGFDGNGGSASVWRAFE